MSLTLRAVYDDWASKRELHRLQLALLAASWHRNVRPSTSFSLEVILTGGAPEWLKDYLRQLGVTTLLRAERHPRAEQYGTCNKLLALEGIDPACRLVLVDLDVVLLRDLASLCLIPDASPAAALADSLRVTDEAWHIIRRRTGLAPLQRSWFSLDQQLMHPPEVFRPRTTKNLYLNGGLVVLPRGDAFAKLWAAHQERIMDALLPFSADDYQRLGAGIVGDQTGLATACGEWGELEILRYRYNFRWSCFRIAPFSASDIELFHMANSPAELIDSATAVEEVVTGFFTERIFGLVDPLIAGAVRETHRLLHTIKELIRQYELDRLPLLVSRRTRGRCRVGGAVE